LPTLAVVRNYENNNEHTQASLLFIEEKEADSDTAENSEEPLPLTPSGKTQNCPEFLFTNINKRIIFCVYNCSKVEVTLSSLLHPSLQCFCICSRLFCHHIIYFLIG
jgi:hypothetical protein